MGNKVSKHPPRAKIIKKSRYGAVNPPPDEPEVDSESDMDDIFVLDDTDGSEIRVLPEVIQAARSRLSTMLTEEDKEAMAVDHTKYTYPFENLVFEGGGNKGMAYCGALKEMEEIGMLSQIKRFAGTSAGAMTAALLAVGYTPDDIREFVGMDMRRIFLDHSCGYLSLLPNLLLTYGWNPGKRVFRWFGDRMHEATQNRDITFRELYQEFGKELCVAVTNLNQMSTTYCHVKTTPDMPVAVAVRMSMAIPGMFSATKYTVFGHTDIFVDGGVLCNYPVHCFDGWWLSMDPQDSFLHKLQPLSEILQKYERRNRFGKWNEKTLGFLLYSDNEQEMYRTALEARRGAELPKYPNTKMARKYIQTVQKEERTARQHNRVSKAVDAFLKVLKDHDVDNSSTISEEELDKALKDEAFSETDYKILFGREVTTKEAFAKIIGEDKSKDQISYQDIVTFLETHGINLHARFLGYRRRDVTDLPSFLDSLQASLVTNVKRIYMEERDVDRTVGINTGYLQTTDFTLEDADKSYLVEQGRRSLVCFLKYYVVKNKPPLKSPNVTADMEKTNSLKAQSVIPEETRPEQLKNQPVTPEEAKG
ncbi:uncharacterized protein LOC135477584 isoform X2 [Liolophura sinensis]|uniref:uncharacterized protein LOC135477584 isoform X2 n=1 Tax=Liolophura sinensis TaxID=3198878 RepID=UPI003158BD9F